VSFSFLKASFKYVVSYKARFPTIKFFHFSNLSLVAEIQTNSSYEISLSVEKSIMKIDNSIYNLEESFYKKGWYFLAPDLNFH
jgi:hypothetical protein